MESMERERHHETRVTYDRSRNHATFVERDLIKNMVVKETGTDIPNCVDGYAGGVHQASLHERGRGPIRANSGERRKTVGAESR